MENQQQTVASPIHRPCPDMAGCSNPDPILLKKSRAAIKRLREKFNFKTAEERQAEEVEYKHYIAGVKQSSTKLTATLAKFHGVEGGAL